MLPACSAVLAMQTHCSMTHRSSSPAAIGQCWLLQPGHANPANLAFPLLPGASCPCQPLELPGAGGSLVLQSMERVRGSRTSLGQRVSERPGLGLTVHWHPCPHLLCPHTEQHPESCRPLHKLSPRSGTSHCCTGPTTRTGRWWSPWPSQPPRSWEGVDSVPVALSKQPFLLCLCVSHKHVCRSQQRGPGERNRLLCNGFRHLAVAAPCPSLGWLRSGCGVVLGGTMHRYLLGSYGSSCGRGHVGRMGLKAAPRCAGAHCSPAATITPCSTSPHWHLACATSTQRGPPASGIHHQDPACTTGTRRGSPAPSVGHPCPDPGVWDVAPRGQK
ncbi:uncharacterized protein ACIB01_015431 isoform 2-T3 [Guaruba guarouba]